MFRNGGWIVPLLLAIAMACAVGIVQLDPSPEEMRNQQQLSEAASTRSDRSNCDAVGKELAPDGYTCQ